MVEVVIGCYQRKSGWSVAIAIFVFSWLFLWMRRHAHAHVLNRAITAEAKTVLNELDHSRTAV